MSNRNLTRTALASARRWKTRATRSSGAMLLVAAALGPTAAHAAPQICGARAELLAELTKRYSEAPVAVGLSNGGALVEVLTNDSGSTWTILVSQPDGTSCLVASGEAWQELRRATASRDLGV